MRVAVAFCLLLLGGLSARASHIVGGEFEIKFISGNTYRVNLILYFDVYNGLSGAKDLNVTSRIYRMSNNTPVMDVFLPLISEASVVYSQPECSIGELQTNKLIYSTDIILSPEVFNEIQGYYIVWERCCRNYTITNIYSENPNFSNGAPNPNAKYAGQTFYLEFPPVVKNGLPFIDSTPRLFPPLSDYACKGKPYYVDFSGTDDDGDSLVYSLVTPLNTKLPIAIPPGGPGTRPFPDVQWKSGYGLSNVMGGFPDLAISQEGLLTVTPQQTGLFVFAVKCEEFRDGVKIGEARRDFQMLAVQCKTSVPPIILGKKLTDSNFTHKDNMVVAFDHVTSDTNRCIEVKISDKDIQNDFDAFKERIKIRVIGIDKNLSANNVNLPQIRSATLTQQDSVVIFKICFVECPTIKGSYKIGIIASDDACALPLLDTLRITVNPTPNIKPEFTTVDVQELMQEGQPIKTWAVEAIDTDGDMMNMSLLLESGVVLANVGMNFSMSEQIGNSLKGVFSWDPRCNVFDFRNKTEFEIKILAKDKCEADTMKLTLKIKLPDNDPPIIDNTLSTEKRSLAITRKIYETINFNVLGDDVNDDALVLGGHGIGFTLANVGATFPQVEGLGPIRSPFTWFINCDKINLQEKNEYQFRFILVDSVNYCRIYKADTLDLFVHVDPPDNLNPLIQAASITADQITDGTLTIIRGNEIKLKITGTDADVAPQDMLSVDLVDAVGSVNPLGYSFIRGEGIGGADGFFTWDPDCSIFQNGIYENQYTFTFEVTDNRCFNAEANRVDVQVIIKDEEPGNQEFLPPNIITPDGNGKNEFFAMVEFVPPDQYVNILPKDNCIGSFVNIRIYDRWGNQVYESSNRDFRWYANNISAGVYFYFLTYTHKQYKGTVSIKF